MNNIRTEAESVAKRLIDNGHQAYYVGGGVRDFLLNQPVKDIDIATSANPIQIQKLFPGSDLVGASFGVIIVKQGEHSFEVATFRKDGRYVDCRHPESIAFGTMEDDAHRRDFTINALYQHPINKEIVDFHNGIDDLNKKVIRCVGSAYRRIEEDALRMLRAIRFASRFGFTIERKTRLAINQYSPAIDRIANERVREELDKMITGPNPAMALELLKNTFLLYLVLPEVGQLVKIKQDPIWHYKEFGHTVRKKMYLD